MSNQCESGFQVFPGPKPAGLRMSLSLFARSKESDQKFECKLFTQLQKRHPVQRKILQFKTSDYTLRLHSSQCLLQRCLALHKVIHCKSCPCYHMIHTLPDDVPSTFDAVLQAICIMLAASAPCHRIAQFRRHCQLSSALALFAFLPKILLKTRH